EDMLGLLGVVGPETGQEIGLELQPNRQPVELRLAQTGPLRVYPLGDAEQILHMVADLVSNQIGLGEFPRGTKASFHILKETEVQIDHLVPGAIERSDSGVRRTARRI